MNATTPPTPNPPLILIVDDSPANLHVLAALLRDDYRIKTATDGPTALTLAAKADRPQLILLDMMMPGMDGLEALARLRGTPGLEDTPVVFMTAKVQRAEVDAYVRAGALGVIPKPFDPMALPGDLLALMGKRG